MNSLPGTTSGSPPHRVTIRMVAERAGVSNAAVYAVLNRGRKSNIGVGEKTRKTIEKAIAELGYIPNNSARMLVSGRSNNIGILLNTVEVQFSRMLGKVLSERCMQNGLMPFVEYYNFEPGLEKRKLEMFFSRGVDALIVIASGRQNLEVFERYTRCGIPLLIYGRDALDVPGAVHIGVDELSIAAELVGFLARNRVERTAYLGYTGQTYPIEMRGMRIAEALAAHRIELVRRDNVAGFREAAAAVAAILALPPARRPQALIAFTDELANVAVNAVLQSGHSLNDLPVIGVDGLERPFDTVPLTSVQLPFEEIIDGLWQGVIRGIRGEASPLSPYRPQMILRESTPGFHL